MADLQTLFTALQYADTFFPAGTISFSWGLEGLNQDNLADDTAGVAAFVEGQLRHRWAPGERNMIIHARNVASDLEAVLELDFLQHAMTIPAEQRHGSRTNGRALLNTHDKLGTRFVPAYRSAILEGRGHGHVAVAQGVIAAGSDMDETTAMIVAGYGCCTGILGAAVRLGLITAIDSQKILTGLGSAIIETATQPVLGLDEIGGFSPQNDIAMMRHEVQEARLFSN